TYRFDPSRLRSKGLQFLSPDQLQKCLECLGRYDEVLQGNWDAAGLQATAERLARELQSPDPQTAALASRQAWQLITSLSSTISSDQFLSPWIPCLESPPGGTDSFAPVYQID